MNLNTRRKKEIIKMTKIVILVLALFGLLLVGQGFSRRINRFYKTVSKIQEYSKGKQPELDGKNITNEQFQILRGNILGFVIPKNLATIVWLFIIFQLSLKLWFTKKINQANALYFGLWLLTESGIFSQFGFLSVSDLLLQLLRHLPKILYVDTSISTFLFSHAMFIGISFAIAYLLRNCWIRRSLPIPNPIPNPIPIGGILLIRSCRKG